MSFVSIHERKVDDKWRIPLPRELLLNEPTTEGSVYHFTRQQDHLILFSDRTFKETSDKLCGNNPLANEPIRLQFHMRCHAKTLDKAGRITVPERLREKSGLSPGANVTIAGAGTYAVFWPSDRLPPEVVRMLDDDSDFFAQAAKAIDANRE